MYLSNAMRTKNVNIHVGTGNLELDAMKSEFKIN